MPRRDIPALHRRQPIRFRRNIPRDEYEVCAAIGNDLLPAPCRGLRIDGNIGRPALYDPAQGDKHFHIPFRIQDYARPGPDAAHLKRRGNCV